jgi:RimJ/RimL family protein N-acetyltransferase
VEDHDGLKSRWRTKFRVNLDTPRFLLRPLTPGDEAWLTPIWADAEVNRYLWEPDLTPGDAKKAAEIMVELDAFHDHFGQWAIQDKGSGELHGWVELGKLRPWPGPGDEISLSYVLRRGSWGRGIATEAAGRLLQHAFEAHRLERVLAVVISGNTASKRVLTKLGMRLLRTASSADGKQLEYFSIDNPAPPPNE